MRYALFSPILNTKNALANSTPADGGAIVSAQDGGWYDRSTIHPDKNDWAPRVGFSYQPVSGLVVRGAYGTFYQHSERIGSSAVIGLNPPFIIDGQIDQQVGSTTPLFQLQNGFPSDQFTPALVDLTRLQTRAQDPNQRTGYVHQVSFGPQFSLTDSLVLDLSYVGNFGRKMNRLRNRNQGRVVG